MPVELKEVVEYFGYKVEDIKDLNDLKTKFDSDFVRASNITEDFEPVKKIVGKIYGTLENEIKKVAKTHDLDVDFDSEDIKSKKVTEKLKFAFSKYDEKNKSVLEELKTKAGQGNDEKVKEWEGKYEKLKNKYSDTEGLLKKTTEDFEGFKQTKDKEIKGVKLDIHKKDIYAKAKFLPEANEYTKKGFLNDFEQKYVLDLDENEKPVIMDKKGQRIPNPKVTGTFYEVSDLLQEEMINAKLYALNPQGGKQKAAPIVIPGQAPQGTPTRQVAKRIGV